MIFGNIKDAHRYYSVHPKFKEAFEFLAKLSEDNLPDGIAGEDFRIGVPKAFGKNFDVNPDGTPRQFEAHRQYLDIHYCIAGSEGFGYNDVARLTPATEYNGEKDFQMLVGEAYKLVLRPGDFCVVFPEDAHIPQLMADPDGRILKSVVKIKV